MRGLILAMTACLLGAACEMSGAAAPDNQIIDTFFRDYAEAFRSRSKPRLLAKFCLPLTFLTRAGPVVFRDEEQLSTNLDALLRRYDQIQAVDWKYTIKDVRAMSAGIYLVEIEWRFFNAGNELLYACDTSYFLAADTKAGVQVMAIIAHNETERYEEALKRKKPAAPGSNL